MRFTAYDGEDGDRAELPREHLRIPYLADEEGDDAPPELSLLSGRMIGAPPRQADDGAAAAADAEKDNGYYGSAYARGFHLATPPPARGAFTPAAAEALQASCVAHFEHAAPDAMPTTTVTPLVEASDAAHKPAAPAGALRGLRRR